MVDHCAKDSTMLYLIMSIVAASTLGKIQILVIQY